jgi:hypothetical protein
VNKPIKRARAIAHRIGKTAGPTSQARPPSPTSPAAHPSPASSEQTVRYLLDRGGDRQLNRAVHMIIVTGRRCGVSNGSQRLSGQGRRVPRVKIAPGA